MVSNASSLKKRGPGFRVNEQEREKKSPARRHVVINTGAKVTNTNVAKKSDGGQVELVYDRSFVSNIVLVLFAMIGVPIHIEKKSVFFLFGVPLALMYQVLFWSCLQVGYLEFEVLKADENLFYESFDKHVNYYNLNSIVRGKDGPLELLGRGNVQTSISELTEIIMNEGDYLNVGFYSMKDAREFVRKTQLTGLRLRSFSIFSGEAWAAVLDFILAGRPAIENSKKKSENDSMTEKNDDNKDLELRTLESIKTNNHLVEKRGKQKFTFRSFVYNEFGAFVFSILGIVIYHVILHCVVGNRFQIGDALRALFDVRNDEMVFGEKEKMLVSIYECIIGNALIAFGMGNFVCGKLVTGFNLYPNFIENSFIFQNNETAYMIFQIFTTLFVGVILIIKFWAAFLLGPEVYHWNDIFMEKKYINFNCSGPFKWFAHPMYAVGYLIQYGGAVLEQNVYMFIHGVISQFLILQFGRIVEGAHCQRFYMMKKFRSGKSVPI